MELIKVVACMIIICGIFVHFVPDGASRYAFDCVVIFGICIYILNSFSLVDTTFDFDKKSLYSELEYYTEYVTGQQRKLFDDIADKEHNENELN